MNILLADDQPDVIKGIMAGIDWTALGFAQVFTVYSAAAAQEIIRTQDIQIMVCDIEMPNGTGIELLDWVQQNNYKIKCIFLTAHDDFKYVQQAVKLQSFDYILQPAPYAEIEASVCRAVAELKASSLIDSYYQYGLLVTQKRSMVVSNLLREYLLEYPRDAKETLNSLRMLQMTISRDTLCHCYLFDFFDLAEDQKWNPNLFWYALDQVLKELLEGILQGYVLVALSKSLYCLLFTAPSGAEVAPERLQDVLEEFIQFSLRYLKQRCAVYQAAPDTFDNLPEQYRLARENAKNNVAYQCRLFPACAVADGGTAYSPPAFEIWMELYNQKKFDAIYLNATQYLKRHTESGALDARFLKQLHQDVMCWFFGFLEARNLKASDVFSQDEHSRYSYVSLMNSFASIEDSKNMFLFITRSLNQISAEENDQSDRLCAIHDYVRENIHKRINREEIAQAVYLNPEYLSRMFKKQTGVTLSSYIVAEKMKTAKSLIKTTDFPISIVASKVGFTNFSHFASSFKRAFGVSPSDLRTR